MVAIVLAVWHSVPFNLSVIGGDGYDDVLRAGMDHAYRMQPESAAQIFDDLIQRDPKNPKGHLFQAVNFYHRMQFDEDPQRFENKFNECMTQAIKLSQKQTTVGEKRVEALFHLGTAYLYQAAFHGEQESWLKAYYYGREGISHLEKVVAVAPDYYDAYLGLGLYHYYADVIPKSVQVVAKLLGIGGDRERGLNELKMAAEKGDYSKAEALFFMGNIYLYTEKDVEKSLQCARELARLYPENPGFQTLLAENLQRQGQHEEAISVLQRAFNQDSELLPYFRISINYHLGNAYANWQKLEEALSYYERAIAIASRSTAKVNAYRAWTHFKIADCHTKLGNPNEAVLSFKRVKKSDDEKAHNLAKERLRELDN
jgi:tetratricopeptide (TPR) repeat protein